MTADGASPALRRIPVIVSFLNPQPSPSALAAGAALHVESPGGLSPPGAPRSVREPLDSYGSRCSAVSMAELPVGKECWIYPA